MVNRRWQDWATLIAGLWFAISPWILRGGDATATMGPMVYNALAVGLALALFSAGLLARPQAWEEAVDFLIGLWAMASPWALNYTSHRPMTSNALVVGLSVAILAAWVAMERGHIGGHWRHHA